MVTYIIIIGGVTASMMYILRVSVKVMVNFICPRTRIVRVIFVNSSNLIKLWSEEGIHVIPVTSHTVELQLLLLLLLLWYVFLYP